MMDINRSSRILVVFLSLYLFSQNEGLTSGEQPSTTPRISTRNSRIQQAPERFNNDNNRETSTGQGKTDYVCGYPGSPEHGEPFPSRERYRADEQVSYTCKFGYLPFPSTKRKCLESGTWVGQMPVCDTILELPEVRIQTSNDPTGVKREAFDRNPNTCTHIHGPTRWWRLDMLREHSVRAIVMKIKNQPYGPSASVNTSAYVIQVNSQNNPNYRPCNSFSNTKGETTFMLKCPDQGIAGKIIHIEERGYNNYFLLCEVAVYVDRDNYKCGKPETPLHGSVQYNDSIAEYRCDPGFYLSGRNRQRHCRTSGQWTGTQPVCEKEVTCPTPEVPHGSVHFTTPDTRATVDTVATFVCDEGYRISETSELLCLSNGQWSGKPPFCVALDCGQPPSKYTPINVTSTTYGNYAEIICPHRTNQKAMIHCLKNGSWSPPGPCKPMKAQEENRGDNLVEEPDTSGFPAVVVVMVVLSLLVALLIFVIFFLLFRRRKNARKPEESANNVPKTDPKATTSQPGHKDDGYVNETMYAQVAPINGVGKACGASHSQYYQHVINQGATNDQRNNGPKKKHVQPQQWNLSTDTVYAVIDSPKSNGAGKSSEGNSKEPIYGHINGKDTRDSKKYKTSLSALFRKKRREKALPVPSPNVVALYAQVNLEAKHRLRMRNQQGNCPEDHRNSKTYIDSDLDTEPVRLRELPPIPSDCDSLYSPQSRCGPNCVRQDVMYDNDLYSSGDGWSAPEESEDLVMVDNSLYGSDYRHCRRMMR